MTALIANSRSRICHAVYRVGKQHNGNLPTKQRNNDLAFRGGDRFHDKTVENVISSEINRIIRVPTIHFDDKRFATSKNFGSPDDRAINSACDRVFPAFRRVSFLFASTIFLMRYQETRESSGDGILAANFPKRHVASAPHSV